MKAAPRSRTKVIWINNKYTPWSYIFLSAEIIFYIYAFLIESSTKTRETLEAHFKKR